MYGLLSWQQDVVGPSQDLSLQPRPCTGNKSRWEDGSLSPFIQTHSALQLSRHSPATFKLQMVFEFQHCGELSLLKTIVKYVTGLGGWGGGGESQGSWRPNEWLLVLWDKLALLCQLRPRQKITSLLFFRVWLLNGKTPDIHA